MTGSAAVRVSAVHVIQCLELHFPREGILTETISAMANCGLLVVEL